MGGLIFSKNENVWVFLKSNINIQKFKYCFRKLLWPMLKLAVIIPKRQYWLLADERIIL